MRLKEAEGWCGWRSLSVTSHLWNKVDIMKRKTRELTTMEEGNKAKSAMYPQEAMWVSAY